MGIRESDESRLRQESMLMRSNMKVYNMFHRQNMHAMLMKTAVGEGKGIPAKLVVNHKVCFTSTFPPS